MTQLVDYFAMASWPKVADSLRSWYGCDEAVVESHHEAWEKIMRIEPEADENGVTTVVLTEHKPDPDSGNGRYVDVSGAKEDGEAKYAIEFMPWSHWLACEVATNRVDMTSAEIVAHCLWEMTFSGFDEDLIQIERGKLKAMADQINTYHDNPEALKEAVENGELFELDLSLIPKEDYE